MAGVNEPSNESVHADLPLPTAGELSDSKSRETVRIESPVQESTGNPPVSSPLLPASVMASLDSPASGLQKETPRVPSVPDPFLSAGETKDPQPRMEMPYVAPQSSSAALASAEKKPMLLWWILLGLSALILIIQIWTYIS